MLHIQATPRLMGVEVTGDYLDLKQLHDVLLTMNADPDNGRVKGQKGQDSDPKIFMEGLIFEIRCAYTGDRSILSMENGVNEIPKSIVNGLLPRSIDIAAINKQFSCGNLYYSFRIPFLDAAAYLFVLHERLRYTDTDFTRFRNKSGTTQLKNYKYIELFLLLLWDTLCECIGEQHCREIWLYANMNSIYSEYDFRYIDLLSTYYMSQCPDMTNQKKINVLNALMRLMLKMGKKAQPASLRLKGLSALPVYSGFGEFMEKQASISEDNEVFMEEIYGKVDWKGLVW